MSNFNFWNYEASELQKCMVVEFEVATWIFKIDTVQLWDFESFWMFEAFETPGTSEMAALLQGAPTQQNATVVRV